MNGNATTRALRRALTAPLHRRSLLRRSAPIWLGLIVTVGSTIPPATSKPISLLPQIPVALAGYPCSSHAGEWTTFTGYLSNSTGTMLAESTSGNVYGRISNVDRIWQPTPGCGYYRYDGIIWATTNDSNHLTVDYGAMSGDGQGCTFLLNTSDYMNSDSGSCGAPSPKLVATISPEGTYHLDSALNSLGDFAYAHSDCITWYGVEPIKTNITNSVTSGKPGANCGNKSTESTGTSQTLVVDGADPTISFSFPAAGGPVLVPSAFAGVTFTATDAVAGFGGTDDWDLQRQKATWVGPACDTTWTNDGALVSGTNQATNYVKSQGLALNTCYRWTLTARDENGNVAGPITSGSIRTDTLNRPDSGGDSIVWRNMESWQTAASIASGGIHRN
jgi:hypothetical protein